MAGDDARREQNGGRERERERELELELELELDLGAEWAGEDEKVGGARSMNRKVLAGVAIGMGACVAVTAPFLTPALRRHILPYVPATTSQLDDALALVASALRRSTARAALQPPPLPPPPPHTLIDLGSGDGRVTLGALQKFDVRELRRADGVELNAWLVWYSRLRAWRLGLRARSKFMRTDLWALDLQRYDVVVVFGVKEMMPDLERKLSTELKPHAAVVATRFALPTWRCAEKRGLAWLYYRSDQR